jgi:hypothetical protein
MVGRECSLQTGALKSNLLLGMLIFPHHSSVLLTYVFRAAPVQPAGARGFVSTHSSSNTFSTTGINKFGLKPASVDPEKKEKYGKLKSTMANSAAGGLGFGAGK